MEALDEVPWSELEHACGSAADVPALLTALKTSLPGLQSDEAPLRRLFGRIWCQGTVYEATSYAVPYLIELAADQGVPDRCGILDLLAAIAIGTSYLDVHEDFYAKFDRSPPPFAGKKWRDRDRTLIPGTDEFRARKDLELSWVAKAREAVADGLNVFISILEEESDAAYASAQVLSRLHEHKERVSHELLQLLNQKSQGPYRAILILLIAETGHQSSDFMNTLDLALKSTSVIEQRAASIALARLGPRPLSLERRLAVVDSILDDDLYEYFNSFRWFDSSRSIPRYKLLECAREDLDNIVERLLVRINSSGEGNFTVEDLLMLTFPPTADEPRRITHDTILPLQQRTLRVLCDAMDKGRCSPVAWVFWGLPDSKRNLRNLAEGCPMFKVDDTLPRLGLATDPRWPLQIRDLSHGQRIHSRYFGMGEILSIEPDVNGYTICVRFDEEDEMRLLLAEENWLIIAYLKVRWLCRHLASWL